MTRPVTGSAPIVLPTVEDTRAFGARLAGRLRAGDVIVLDGPLGAGKTALTQGVGAGLGVSGTVVSPTFVIARVHPGPVPLVHVDAYRLTGADVAAQVDDLDLDVTVADSVTVVEWGSGGAEQLADAHLTVALRRSDDPDDETRTATLHPVGGDWAVRLTGLT